MRKVLFAIVLACSLLLMVQCSGIESLNDFNGKMVTVVSPASKGYTNDILLYSLNSDSLKWLYSCEAGKESQVSIITSGKVQTDSLIIDESDGTVLDTVPAELGQDHLVFSVETYVNNTVSVHQVEINPDGTFSDTILLASSAVLELILPNNSRMFVSVGALAVSDTIPLTNPHSLK